MKSRAGWRTFAVPDELYELLMKHEQVQHRKRVHVGTERHEAAGCSRSRTGAPSIPDGNRDEWRSILEGPASGGPATRRSAAHSTSPGYSGTSRASGPRRTSGAVSATLVT